MRPPYREKNEGNDQQRRDARQEIRKRSRKAPTREGVSSGRERQRNHYGEPASDQDVPGKARP